MPNTGTSKTGVHNESRAEFNGTGPTVDAAVSVPKPSNRELVIGVGALVAGFALKHFLIRGFANAARGAAEVVEKAE